MFAVAEPHIGQRQFRLDLEDGDVRLVVAAEKFRRQRRAVGEGDVDLVGAVDHMIVGDDDALGVDDETRAERLHLFNRAALLIGVGERRRLPAPIFVGRISGRIVIAAGCALAGRALVLPFGLRVVAFVDRLRRRNVDDGGRKPLREVGKAGGRRARIGRHRRQEKKKRGGEKKKEERRQLI